MSVHSSKLNTSFLIFTFFIFILCSAGQKGSVRTFSEGDSLFRAVKSDSSKVVTKESRRIVAIFLCAALGPFGMHRLYLGTEPRVAAAYTVTLGGGFGLLTILDFLHLVFARDISRYRNNPDMIMWNE